MNVISPISVSGRWVDLPKLHTNTRHFSCGEGIAQNMPTSIRPWVKSTNGVTNTLKTFL